MPTDPATWQRIAALLSSPLVTIDIGARGGVSPAWNQFSPNIRIYGFEPDEAECERLNQTGNPITEYIPLAVSSSVGEQPFYVTEDPFCSSLYPPIEQLARERPRLVQMRTRKAITIHTETLDRWANLRSISRFDHIKLDAQGAELAILEGALRCLATVRSVKLEVQFNRLYEGVPLFGQLDAFLREQGFVLWRLSELSHCGFADKAAGCEIPEILDYDSRRVTVHGGGGQLLWANAYYVRREATELSRDVLWEDALRDACLAWAHGYVDLAEVSLRRSLPGTPAASQDILYAVLGSSKPQETA